MNVVLIFSELFLVVFGMALLLVLIVVGMKGGDEGRG